MDIWIIRLYICSDSRRDEYKDITKQRQMKLTPHFVSLISEDIVLRQKLGIALGFTDAWIQSLAKANKVNGPLTTYKALVILREETGKEFEDILYDTVVPAKA